MQREVPGDVYHAAMSDTMPCGFFGCDMELPVSLGRWYQHLLNVHRISMTQAWELVQRRAVPAH